MSRSLRRGALAATAIVFSIASLSACGAGNDAQTLGVKPDTDTVAVDGVKIQNALVITQPKAGEGPAVVSATIFNSGREEQTIDSITLPGTKATVKLTPATGADAVTVPAGGSVILGGKDNASAVVENGSEAGRVGDFQEIVFKLSETGDVKMEALVVPAKSYFSEFGPTEVPQPTAPQPGASGSPATGASKPGKPGEPADDPAKGASTAPSDAASASSSASHGAGH
ncbi:hypothetical protein [Streptomyces purpureus]|uniref:Lipoprotein n=1 Tax=Streptomyces purpureus TaxID=1951 RepID=A0A918LVA4_9ACTN|nr:hypothetical protein [Streptomyces purpureus]GGT55090.1 lipoprotein [Streptomyces purpureus]